MAPFTIRRLLKPAARLHQHKRLISCVYTSLCLYVCSFFFFCRCWSKSCDAIIWVTDPVCLAMNVFNQAAVAQYQINMFPFFHSQISTCQRSPWLRGRAVRNWKLGSWHSNRRFSSRCCTDRSRICCTVL